MAGHVGRASGQSGAGLLGVVGSSQAGRLAAPGPDLGADILVHGFGITGGDGRAGHHVVCESPGLVGVAGPELSSGVGVQASGAVDLAVIAIALMTSMLQLVLRYAGMVGHKLVVVGAGAGVGVGIAHKQVGGLDGVGAGAGLGATSNGDSRASRPTAGAMPILGSFLALLAGILPASLVCIAVVVGIGLVGLVGDVTL
jgi:hypothetical protein